MKRINDEKIEELAFFTFLLWFRENEWELEEERLEKEARKHSGAY